MSVVVKPLPKNPSHILSSSQNLAPSSRTQNKNLNAIFSFTASFWRHQKILTSKDGNIFCCLSSQTISWSLTHTNIKPSEPLYSEPRSVCFWSTAENHWLPAVRNQFFTSEQRDIKFNFDERISPSTYRRGENYDKSAHLNPHLPSTTKGGFTIV